MRCYAYLNREIIDPVSVWFKCHWTVKILASFVQMMVIGDVISDLLFIWNLIEYENGWLVFFSFFILYLSLRFTLVFTVTVEKDFFGVEKSERRFGKRLFKV